jgi:putative membrane protein
MAGLSSEERARATAAADAVRAKTAARFDPLIVPVADRYALYPVAFGAFAALFAGGIVAIAVPVLSLREAFALEAAVFALVSIVLEWLPLKLLLVPRRLKQERARQLAHRAFAARILAAQDRKPGMVLFVALGERCIELVTDDALDRKIGQARWNAIVADFAAAARNGRIGEALPAAIAACGAELEKHFPRSS